MKQFLLGVLAATAISSDVLLRAVVSVNVSNASGSASSSSVAASGSNREEVGLGELRDPPIAPEEAECPASQSASSLSAAPASDSKRRRLRGKRAPPTTDQKQVETEEDEKGGPSKDLCGICYEEFPASDLERFFDACGAGDICAPGHKLCSTCACKLKEEPRANAKNAHCPFCDKTVEGERPDHMCEVCNNQGGPRERRDGTTRGTIGLTPDEAPRVGCWGCGRRTAEVPAGDATELALRDTMVRLQRDVDLGNIRDGTDAQRMLIDIARRHDRGEVFGPFANVIPSPLRAGPPTRTFARDDWNHLPEGMRRNVGLTIPEALQLQEARRMGLISEREWLDFILDS